MLRVSLLQLPDEPLRCNVRAEKTITVQEIEEKRKHEGGGSKT